jgi:tRNA A37 threonylcarbamoyladenosine modification protein TsaB
VPNNPVHRERLCLAIEASNPGVHAEVGVGILAAPGEPPRVLATEALREVGRNEDDLLPAIERACAAAAVRADHIRLVAVSIGPGGYTSLRVACAAGKMIAAAVGAACVGVPTPLAVARSRSAQSDGADARVGVILAGKDRSAYLTIMPRGGWRPGTLLPLGKLVTAADFPTDAIDRVIGDRHIPAEIAALLAARGCQVLPPRFSASACLELASALPETNPVHLVPFYAREPDAVTLWRQRAKYDQNK